MSPSVALVNIGELVTNDPGAASEGDLLGLRHDAALVVEGSRVGWVGPAAQVPAADTRLDLGGRAVLPGWVDSHSHLAFASGPAGDLGSIVAATRAATDEQLIADVGRLVLEMRHQGTTTVEIKSGFGLSVRAEARSLAIAQQFTPETTFLGAHVVPTEYADDPAAYVELVTGPMLAAAAPYAIWIDVHCERGAFDVDQARAVLLAGAAVGLRGRLHANRSGPGPGVRLAAELGLLAVDHCTYLEPGDVDALRGSGTVATLLPGVAFATRHPYADARTLLDAGVRVALASGCGPGAGTSSMALCVALAVRELAMTPAEAVYAATSGGAAALGRHDVGRLTVGARADLQVLDAPGHVDLARRPGVPLTRQVWIGGRPLA